MTEEERFLFDLQGYLIIENALAPETVAEMNAWLDAQAEKDPAWRGQIGNEHIEDCITWGPAFRNLMDHPRIFPYFKEICGNTVRLDHDYAIFLQPGHTGLHLHGPTVYPYDPIHYYHCIQGKIFSGLAVATYALTDAPLESGGLVVIPGSHKCNFRVPQDISRYERPSPILKPIPTKAGDCVIFTEALIHGTLPWKGPGVRRTLFFKYAPGGVAWTSQSYFPVAGNPRVAAIEDELTETQRWLLMRPSAKDHRPPR